jgi:hypothetical protein
MNSSPLQNALPWFPLRTLGADQIPIYATLLKKLESSLGVSQKALLSLDVAAVEQGTTEQNHLFRQIEALYFANAAASAPDDRNKMQASRPISSVDESVELRASQARILHLGRVHAALLSKAQRALNLVTHLRSLPDATYAAPIWPADASRGTLQLMQGKD